MEPFLGMITLFGFNFAPRGWAFCHGQLLAIAQNPALFSLLGTTYGGDGITTFALPDLRGRVATGWGQGPGLSFYDMGERAGNETTTLTVLQMPIHNHVISGSSFTGALRVSSGAGNQRSPANAVLAAEASGVTAMYNNNAPDTTTAPGSVEISGSPTIQTNGGSQPFSIQQPYLGLNYCIALEGIFPSRP